MRDPVQRAERRARFLEALYVHSGSDQLELVDGREIAVELDLSEAEADAIGGELVQRGFAPPPQTGSDFQITTKGIIGAEERILNTPDHPRQDLVMGRRERRVELLQYVYDASGQSTLAFIDDFSGFDADASERRSLSQYLAGLGLVRHEGVDGLAITASGMAWIEESGDDDSLRL